jgi:serine phosphatase RsbU (regulator of sigma subunit)/putative methionine-R-sulfoxide reductase with GAF domain
MWLKTRSLVAAVLGPSVGIGGLTLLTYLILSQRIWTAWPAALMFSVLSLLVQRSSLHLTSVGEPTRDSVWLGSLVGVMDLAAIMALGPVQGGAVAALSGLVYLAASAGRRYHLEIRRLVVVPIFDAGLKALMALVCGWLLVTFVSVLPLESLPASALPALLGVCIAWFGMDRLGWGMLDLGRDPVSRVRAYSAPAVLVELLPLPLAAVVALTYTQLGWGPFGLLALALVVVAALTQRWADAHTASQRRVAELTMLDQVGRAIAQAQMDVDELCELMYEQVRQLVDATIFHLGLLEGETLDMRLSVRQGVRQSPQMYTLVPGEGLINWMRSSQQPILVSDFEKQENQLPAKPTYVSADPPRSALFVPLMAGDTVVGSMAVQSFRPAAYAQDDLRLVSAMGNQAAMAIQKARLFEREQRRARQLETIEAVGRQVMATLELEVLFKRVVRLIRDNFGYYHVGIFTVDSDRECVQFEASASAREGDVALDVAWGQGLIGWVAQEGQPLLANDVDEEIRYRPVEALEETEAELVIPLRLEERLVGVLDVQSNHRNAFDADDLFILQTLGDQIAIAIQEAQLYEAERQQAWMSTALLQVAEATSQLSDLDDVLDTVVRLVPLLGGVDRCGIWLWNESREVFVPARAHGLGTRDRETFSELRFEAYEMPAFDLVRWEKTPLAVTLGDREDLLPESLIVGFDIQEALALPLMSKGELMGVILAGYADASHSFSPREVQMLTGLANQAAMVIESARLVQAQQEEVYVSTALLQVAESVNRAANVEETLATVVRITPILVGVERCALFLWNERDSVLFPVQQYGFSQDALPVLWDVCLPVDSPLVHDMLDGTGYLMLDDVDAWSETWPGELASGEEELAFMGLPLVARSEILGVMFVDSKGTAQRFTDRWLNILTGIANQAAIAIEADFLRQTAVERERMERELEVARQIQVSFLPQSLPDLLAWDLAAHWQAARQVGGDFYDFFPLPARPSSVRSNEQRWGVLIADVADKGVPAALFMALSRTLFRTVALTGRPPAEVARRANQLILSDARSDLFVTLFYAILEPGGRVSYVSCGHHPPLLVRANSGEVIELRTPGIVLGAVDEDVFEDRETSLEPGDSLVLYTDGITEAINAEAKMFGRERLAELLRSHAHHTAADLARIVCDGVADFVGDVPQSDDLAIVVVRREQV